jgi:hypothetical protein
MPSRTTVSFSTTSTLIFFSAATFFSLRDGLFLTCLFVAFTVFFPGALFAFDFDLVLDLVLDFDLVLVEGVISYLGWSYWT